MKQDDITLNLSTDLSRFLDFLKSDLPRKILELDTNVRSDNYLKELNRIVNSLEQYTKKEVDLFYVGFLGSYSSGKTSTINSLLSLWDTDKARNVSNNPTDDCITLITNQSNVNSVFNFSKEGAISIRTNTNFDIPFLENTVLMDTPGSGDPNIIEAIVRDSLPLCDLIVYTLNSTAPFTDIDRPFLIAQQTKLKNIPILFVLTRADEFNKNKTIGLTNENFDSEKYKTELKILVGRINESINISDFSEDNFITIDNVSLYNIENLKAKIQESTSNSQENLITLHNHKLSYFKSEIKEIHKYFSELSENKIEKCEDFIDKAKDNIDYFNHQIDISKTKFSVLWSENRTLFNSIHYGTTKGYVDQLIDKVRSLGTNYLYTFRSKYRQNIEKEASNKSASYFRKIEEIAFNQIIKLKDKTNELIDYQKLDIEFEPLSTDFEIEEIPLQLPFSIEDYSNEFFNEEKTNQDQYFSTLKDSFEQITKTIAARKPSDKIIEHLDGYKKSSLEILNLYYDAVKMYNVVAFSFEVKSYISELGLAGEFDKLESIDPNRGKYNLIAEEELIKDSYDKIKLFETKLSESNISIENLQNQLIAVSKLKQDTSIEDITPIVNESLSSIEIENLNLYLSESYESLKSNIQDQLNLLKRDIKALKSKQRYKYLKLFGIYTLSIFGILFLVMKFSEINMPTSISGNIIISLVGGFIFSGITRLFDKSKNRKEETIKEAKDKLQKSNNELIEKLYADFKNTNEDRKLELEDKLKAIWTKSEYALKESLVKKNETIHKELGLAKINFIKIIDSYKTHFSDLHFDIMRLFTQQETQLETIDKIASTIKEDSIKPSFDLLSKTLEEIKTVKREIDNLDF